MVARQKIEGRDRHCAQRIFQGQILGQDAGQVEQDSEGLFGIPHGNIRYGRNSGSGWSRSMSSMSKL